MSFCRRNDSVRRCQKDLRAEIWAWTSIVCHVPHRKLELLVLLSLLKIKCHNTYELLTQNLAIENCKSLYDVCVCIYIYICVCVCVCVYIYIYIYIYIYGRKGLILAIDRGGVHSGGGDLAAGAGSNQITSYPHRELTILTIFFILFCFILFYFILFYFILFYFETGFLYVALAVLELTL
jgi:hypothetical protein